MKRYGFSGVWLAMLVVACASGGGSGESETHFFKCTTDLDCPVAERCVARRCTSTPVVASASPSNKADSGAGGARGSLDGSKNAGGTGGARGSTGGTTNAGGTGGVVAASSGGNAGDAGVGTSTDAGGAPSGR